MASVAILRAMRPLQPTLDDYPDLTAQMLYCACPTPEHKPFFTLHMAVALNLGLTFLVAALSYYGVERPLVRLGHRLTRGRPKSVVAIEAVQTAG